MTKRRKVRANGGSGTGAPLPPATESCSVASMGETRCTRCGGALAKEKDLARGRHWRCASGHGGRRADHVPEGEEGQAKIVAVSLYPSQIARLDELDAGGGRSAVVRRLLDEAGA